jgi:sugar transferase EpsL
MNRGTNIILGGVALLVLIPILLILAGFIYWRFGLPVLFRQTRTGLKGKLFTLYKFRTMSEIRDESGNLIADAKRLHKFGRFLRSTSLDELPSFWNVLKGDINLVGPRPLLPQYLNRYTKEQARRMEIKPGITGWAQINGRNAISWEKKFKLDVWYVDNRSLFLDLKILLITVVKVITREGVTADSHVAMPEFMG